MASTNLSKTPGSAGNRKKFNFSFWVKGNDFVSDYMFFSASGSTESTILFDASSRLEYYEYNGSSKTTKITTKRKFRDPSAWYHIVVSIDTTQSTSTNRVKIYVNGTQETDLENTTYGAQDFDSLFNNTTTQYIGSNASGGNFDGYMDNIRITKAERYTGTDNISVPTVEYYPNGQFNNATGSFESNVITADATTSKMGAVVTYQDVHGTNTLNTDIVLKLSADNGSNYSTATLVAQPNFATGTKLAKVNDVSVTGGTQLKYKVEFANQSDGSKVAAIRGDSLMY